MKRPIFLMLAMSLLLTPIIGCGGSGSDKDTAISISDDQTVTIGTADSVTLSDGSIIRLTNVDDKSCPTGFACLRFEQSFVTVALFDSNSSTPAATKTIALDAEEIITSPTTGISFSVRPTKIEPQRTSFDPVPQETYRVTLQVQRIR